MPEFVRVRCLSTKHEKSIPADAPREGWEVLNKPATNPDGTALPDKHYVAPESLSDITKTGPKADNPKGA
jgi:hypothetical protein